MRSSNKVFIHNSQGSSNESAEDLKAFFLNSRAIFETKPDVIEIKTPFNMDGLKCPTFVMPGGSALVMRSSVKSLFKTVRSSQVGENFNYVGICAGAFLAIETTDIFTGSPHFTHFGAFPGMGLVDDFKAVGAFCPTQEVNPSTKTYVPYSVSISYSCTRRPSKQLYVNGPGFFAVKTDGKNESEIAARYEDRDSYTFYYNQKKVSVSDLPAMVMRKHSDKRGGVFLSGTHFEASVEDSKLLKAFEQPSEKVAGLAQDDYKQLEDLVERENTRIAVEVLLRRTLK